MLRESYKWMSNWFLYLTTPTKIRLGATWYAGGGVEGKGRYVANANVYFVVDSIGAWEKFKVSAHFEQPMVVGNALGQLSGYIDVSYYEYSTLSRSLRATFALQGDTYGRMSWVS